MNETVIVAGIGAVALIVVALISAMTARNVAKSNEHIAEMNINIIAVKGSVDTVVHSVDGKLEKMLQFMEDANYRKGRLDERDRADLLATAPPTPTPKAGQP